MRRVVGAMAAAACLPALACGLGLEGSALELDRTPDATVDGAPPSEADGASPADADPDAQPEDAGVDVYEAGPTDAGPPIGYVVSTRFWSLVPTTKTWAGATQLPAGGCGALEDLAMDEYGRVFGTTTTNLYLVDPSGPSCTTVGSAGTYPVALGFAPRGTLAPNGDVLVGIQGNGDYVRIDTSTGAVTTVKAGALAGYTAGDIVNVGLKGYVVVSGGACTQDCLFQLDFTTGNLVGGSLGMFPTSNRVGGLFHWGGKLWAFASPDTTLLADPTNPAGATSQSGPSGYVNVSFRGAASTTIAPTQ